MKELLHDHDVWADGQALGQALGESIGEERGIDIGSGLVNSLARLMNEAGRGEEFLRSTSDPALQDRLMAEFGLTAETSAGA